MTDTENMIRNAKKTVVEFSTWYWSKADVRRENALERRLGLPLSRPGFYAQRRKADRSGYFKARRFATAEARDRFVDSETKRLMLIDGSEIGITLTTD